ncbi:hypothetical protein D8Y22_06335 [Salinadaptatus halalkaliphilus]|uniref:Uncharacterized protein n=1 Tax=Salinadaptatus halalkaliphilus TaxID=2419781 RepID=A0A4S3TQ23_9EURY|nr:hypothetical protein [Salinadaptatus halalkaliphilus]THE65780.1 hypothetical protein D8Y22_06335 [Salinadaptatus halalkaliphilus]
MYERQLDRSERGSFDALVDVLAAANRYDFLLAVVPVAFVVALVAATVLGTSMVQTLFVAALIGVLVIVDACYLHPPSDQGST